MWFLGKIKGQSTKLPFYLITNLPKLYHLILALNA